MSRQHFCNRLLQLLVYAGMLPAFGILSNFFVASPISVNVIHAAENAKGGTNGGTADNQNTVRLVFFNAVWPDVLRKVAEETQSELVMRRAPEGRFSRRDFQRYSRAEAVRILNRELEPTGFRLLEQGQYLVVLHLDALRTRYRRPALPTGAVANPPASSSAASRVSPAVVSADVRNASRNEDLVKKSATTFSERNNNSGPVPLNQSLVRDGLRYPVASYSRVARESMPLDRASRRSLLVVPTHNRGAKEVARIIFMGLKPRTQLIDSGPNHLPAFCVYRSGTKPSASKFDWMKSSNRRSVPANSADVRITVGIDTRREELVVDASRKDRVALAEMIRYVDSVDVHPGGDIRLVASEKETTGLASSLKPVLRLLVAQNEGRDGKNVIQQPAEARRPHVEDPEKQTKPAGQPRNDGETGKPDQPEGPPTDVDPPFRLKGLRGPVSIQEVPGIGMVVTGNQDDVDAVVRLMQELERVVVGVKPSIHLLLLRHVHSEAMAGLLNDVYEQLTTIRSIGANQRRSASIIPVVRPNAVLIVAGAGDMQSIRDLADKLDQPVDPRAEIEVFSLKAAVAAEVVRTLDSFYEQQAGNQQSVGLSVQMKAVADIRTNSVIVQAAPRDLSQIALLILKIDRDSSAAVSAMRVIPLKNAVADELADVINTSIQSILEPARAGVGRLGGQIGDSGGQTAQRSNAAKSVVLEFLATDGDSKRKIRSGLLADIRVTADPRMNSLIISAPEQSMPLMVELIRQLDQPSSNVAEIKVFTITNSDAAAMAQLLESLFAPQDQQNQGGIQVVGAEDASSGLIPIRFSVDIRTNSVIAVGGAEALRVVEALLLRLDESDIRQRKTTVFKLKNSPAGEVAASITRFLQAQRELAQIDPNLVSNVELLEREIIVEPELISNSLLISATPRYQEEIMQIIEKLDEAPAQVIIQVLIVEVVLQNTDEFGIELGFQDSVLFDRGLLNLDNFRTITESLSDPGTGIVTTTERVVNQELLPGFLFNNKQLGNNNLINPGRVSSQGLSNFSLGRINGDLGFGGLVLSASSESVSVLLRALSAQRNVQILSRPQIRTVDNQLAQIQVGQQVPVISGVTTNNLGGITPVLGTPQQVGIILQVTPRITPDGNIVMETIANKSAISGQGVPILSDPTTGAIVESPIFDLSEVRATVSVPDGQTIVLGGMITKADDTLERKVPWLGDIPVIGAAFRYDSTTTRRTELLIFMTPRIVRNAADSELIKQVETERLHFSEQDAEEIHGPLFAVPPETYFNSGTQPKINTGVGEPVPSETHEADEP